MHSNLAPGVSGAFSVFCYSRKSNNKPKKKPQEGSSKKEEVAPKQADSQKPSRPPPRIVDTSVRSLKSQLRIVKSWQNGGSSAVPAVQRKYRRKRENEGKAPERELDATEVAAREKMLLMRGKGLTSLYQQKASKINPAAVLVDGYNVMFKWMEHPGQRALKRHLAGDLQAQREAFLLELSAYTGWNRLRMMVAFDAQCNPDAPPVSRDEVGGLEVVFIGEGEADSFIVQEAQSLRAAGCPYVLVATSDNDIRDSCWSNQIFPVSAVQLLQEVNKAKREFEKYQKRRMRDAGSRLGSILMQADPSVYNELEKKRYPGL